MQLAGTQTNSSRFVSCPEGSMAWSADQQAGLLAFAQAYSR